MDHMRAATLCLVVLAGLLAAPAAARDVGVTIDTGTTFQTMEGFGACMNYYALPDSYTDPLWYDMLVYDLGASIVRLPIPPELERFNDDDDPNHINWDGLDLAMMAPRMEFLKEFQKRGITRFMASLWSPPDFMKTNRSWVQGGFLRPDMRDEFAEFMTIFLRAAKERHGIDFMGVSLQNELLFLEFYKSCIYNPAQIREAVRAAMRKFARDDIHAQIMFPEDLMWSGRMIWYVAPTMADPETRAFPGFFCCHGANTPEDWDRFREFAEPFGRQLWMTETGGGRRDWRGAMASATAIHDAIARGNVSAWLFWQFTDLLRGHTPRTGYWPAKHFYRFVRPGAVRIAADADDGAVLATAYVHPVSGKLTAVFINRSDEPAALSVTILGRFPRGRYRAYVSDETSQWAAAQVSGGRREISLAMAPQSIATVQSGPEDDLREHALTDETAGPEDLERRIMPITEPYWSSIGRGAELGQMDWVRRAMGEGAGVNDRAFNGWTPLHWATLWHQKEMIDFLLENGADINAPANDGWTPVHAAAACFLKNTDDLLKSYLDRGGNVNARTTDGWTVLHAAVANAFTAWDYDRSWATDKVRVALDAGADANAPDAKGRTPLHWAAWVGWTPSIQGPVDSGIADVLIEAGANLDAVDGAGRTPLHYACTEGYPAIVSALLAAGARTDVRDADGRTPADVAEARGFGRIVDMLRFGVSAPGGAPEAPAAGQARAAAGEGRYGPALRRAAAAGDVAEVKRLLADGAEPDAQAPRNRKTALHLAAQAGHAAVVEALIEAGANVEAQDSDGFTAAQRARENGYDDIVRLLEAAEH